MPLSPDQLLVLKALYLEPVPQRWFGEIAEIANIPVRRKLAQQSSDPKCYTISEFGRGRLLEIFKRNNHLGLGMVSGACSGMSRFGRRQPRRSLIWPALCDLH
ncbi:hypothetical protein CES86_4108 [Brucella lupini]|jgi:hypothetical protein|uniref:Uncharacterized protein n=1 Tax=Brucella lupini TaxID=255457 RepID=A0A256GFY9_9HYPH|nr:hypothetical protein CES86_4108 [Brucella lupini]